MLVRFSRQFGKRYDKSSPKIKAAFDERLKIFFKNPYDPLLNNHLLKGKWSGYRSINVTGDWRAIYSTENSAKGNTLIIFEMIGTHNQLYKS